MPDEHPEPGPRDTHWWMNSAVVRLAFGEQTQLGAASPGGAVSGAELDPNDPTQRAFGDFELRAVIGRGGMGVVYRAFQHSLDREVALKLLSGGIWAAPEFVATLRSEARYAALLQHPNIVAVHEMGDFDGQIYYAMQLVEGRTLAERLQLEGPVPPLEAATLLRTVAEAVDYAHHQGMLHLDLKPGNVILGEDHVPHVTDFGLARRLGADGVVDNERVSGTPGYMAPEQVQVGGEKLSAASDVWGLGAILYEALTGHPPFEGESPQEVVALVMKGTVRNPRRYNDALPRDLEAICLRCLAKAPSRRYSSARSLADDLGRFIEGREVRARPLNALQHAWRWMRREPRLAMVSAIAMLALLIGVLVAGREWRRAEAHSMDASRNLWAQRRESAWRMFEDSRGYAAMTSLAANLHEQEAAGADEEARGERLRLGLARTRMPTLTGLVDARAKIHVATLSPDGSLVALGLDPLTVALYDRVSGKQRWRVKLQQHRKSWDGQLRRLVFTADGRHLIVGEHWTMHQMRPGGYQTYRLALDTGKQTRIAGPGDLLGESWSDDGRHVLLQAKDGGVTLMSAEGQPLARTRVSTPGHTVRPGWLLPPGLPFIGLRLQADHVDLLDPRTLELRHRIAIDRPGDGFIAWTATPDGRWLVLGTRSGRVLQVDARTGESQLLMADAGGEITWLSTQSHGRRLAVSTRQGDLSLWSLPDGAPIARIVLRRELWGHQLECDERGDHCVVLAMHWDRAAMWAIDSVDGQGGQVTRVSPEITHHSVVPRFASSFNPDTGVLVTGSQDGLLRLWKLPPSPERSARAAPQREWPLHFDGRRLVEVDGTRLRLVDATRDRVLSTWVELTKPIGFAALTADGDALVATAGRELHVLDTGSMAARYPAIVLEGSPMDLVTSGDGRVLLARWLPIDARNPDDSRVQAFDLVLGHPLGPAGDMPFGSARLTRDGQRLLVTNPAGSRIYDIRDLRRPRLQMPVTDERANAVAGELDEAHQELLQVTEYRDGSLRSEIQRWSLRDGQLIRGAPLNGAVDNVVLEPASGTLAISGRPGGTASTDLSVLIRRDDKRVAVTLAGDARLARAQAVSPDGTMIAQALFNGVMLVDGDNGTALGPPLQGPVPANDIIAQVAFAPDGRSLLARTALGRWLVWALASDTRPAQVIEEEAILLAPPPGMLFKAPSDALRASWLASTGTASPTTPTTSAQSPPSPWSCLVSIWPPRLTTIPAYVLDLERYYTNSLHAQQDTVTSFIRSDDSAPGNLCGFPMGPQRLRGVDYDVRGLFRLPAQGGPAIEIPVPAGRYNAAHLLSMFSPPSPDFHLADASTQIEFRYADGTRALQPWSVRLELPDEERHPYWPQVAVAWRGTTPRNEALAELAASLYTNRVVNPHPEREVTALVLHPATPATYDQRILVAAITLAPATPR